MTASRLSAIAFHQRFHRGSLANNDANVFAQLRTRCAIDLLRQPERHIVSRQVCANMAKMLARQSFKQIPRYRMASKFTCNHETQSGQIAARSVVQHKVTATNATPESKNG